MAKTPKSKIPQTILTVGRWKVDTKKISDDAYGRALTYGLGMMHVFGEIELELLSPTHESANQQRSE